MKKQLLFLLGMFAVTVIMAQTITSVSNNKDGATDTTYQNALPGYNGPCKCSDPMTSDEFNNILTDIKAKGTDPQMLSFAKTIIPGKCLLASQVEKIMFVFMYEINRSDFLKFAKTYIYDLDNYYSLRIKYQSYGHSKDYGQLYNPTEFEKNQYPGRYVNELDKNYI